MLEAAGYQKGSIRSHPDFAREMGKLEKENEELKKELLASPSEEQKTRQEMAEWLSQHVIPEESVLIDGCSVKVGRCPINELEMHIYSPDGFFAVWNAVERKSCQWKVMGETMCSLAHRGDGFTPFHGDRYDAFYSAVYEAMNNKEESK